ncbi:glc8-like protein [Grosmannia clavigera kw1407]|uniref:Glc8-like protein n=1 Tax=Grosmannia clavigera (strain kw1407 / UAMH 11150) TaxID=655863 RepID=F0XNU0_GROCL|nr:glc8-like protein [Grosmannia clavigera kw1407]EFX00038.1 glc8-like protein [Grosmannia clavigera kw1407]
MASADPSPALRAPLQPDAGKPKGILKHPTRSSPPPLPTTATPDDGGQQRTEKEETIHNTHLNAGLRRLSSSATRPSGSRRISSRTPSIYDDDDDSSPRLKWDEVNLYLTEQERTATMKIDEPKTPYVKHYDPSEDPSDDEVVESVEDDIPGLSLGEPEEAVPEDVEKRPSKVHVDDAGSVHGDDDMIGMSAEEREKHLRFEQMRKRHYEMRNVAKFLGHPEELDELADDEDKGSDASSPTEPPPVPRLPKTDSS